MRAADCFDVDTAIWLVPLPVEAPFTAPPESACESATAVDGDQMDIALDVATVKTLSLYIADTRFII